MNRALFTFAVLLAVLRLPATASAQAPTGTPKLRVAVMDLSGSALSLQTSYQPSSTTTTIAIPPPAEFARGLTEMMTTALVEAGRFVVLDRKALQQVLTEQDFGVSGRVNPETAPAIGQAIGAQVLITGDITEFTYNKTSLAGNLSILQSLGARGEQIKAMVALDLRLIDAVTGEVVFSKRVEGDASATGVQADINVSNQQFGTGVGTSTPLGKASREAIENAVEAIVEGLDRVPWSGRVVDVRGTSVYVNAGSESGMRVGTELDVFAQQTALVDPETGVSLGAPDQKIGRIRVAQVEEKYAVAQVLDGGDFGRGNLVRIAGSRERS
jgi:curli biogenesis system outer membrane secretion channel CsgG